MITLIAIVVAFLAFLYSMWRGQLGWAVVNLALCIVNIIIDVENGYNIH